MNGCQATNTLMPGKESIKHRAMLLDRYYYPFRFGGPVTGVLASPMISTSFRDPEGSRTTRRLPQSATKMLPSLDETRGKPMLSTDSRFLGATVLSDWLQRVWREARRKYSYLKKVTPTNCCGGMIVKHSTTIINHILVLNHLQYMGPHHGKSPGQRSPLRVGRTAPAACHAPRRPPTRPDAPFVGRPCVPRGLWPLTKAPILAWHQNERFGVGIPNEDDVYKKSIISMNLLFQRCIFWLYVCFQIQHSKSSWKPKADLYWFMSCRDM